MAGPSTRQLVDTFYAVYTTGARAGMEAILHDDIVWTISGPTYLLGFCGVRHGKAAVLELSTRILPDILGDIHVTHEQYVIDGDQAAVLNRMAARRPEDGHPITYRFAHFLRFKDSKLIEIVAIIDTYDATEQILGQAFSTHDTIEVGDDNLVSL